MSRIEHRNDLKINGDLTANNIIVSGLVDGIDIATDVTANTTKVSADGSVTTHSDVVVTSVADNEVLAYNTATSKWINQTAAEVGLATSSHNHTASNITDFDAATDARITAQKGNANGLASLDGGGKVPASQLSLSNVVYIGTWNANTNTPLLVNGTGTQGNYYVVSVAGTTSIDGITDWAVGDWIIFNGTVWEKSDHTDSVTSVAGKQGAVTLQVADITDLIDTGDLPEGSNLYYTEARVNANSNVTANTAKVSADGAITTHSDVVLTSVVDHDVLVYDTATSKWINHTVAEAGLAASSHTHNASDINAGTLGDARVAESNVTQHVSALVHQSLSGAGTNTHAQIDTHIADATKHRIINDSGTGATELWSASKIGTELGTKATSSHNHVIADITDLTDTGDLPEGSNLYYTEARVNANSNVTANTAKVSATGSIETHSDIVVTSVADNEVLAYNSGTSKWINQTAAEAGLAASSHTHNASDINAGTLGDARVAESNVTQHVGALVHQSLSGAGTNTHAQIDTHIAAATNPHSVTKAQVGLTNVEDLKIKLNATVSPTATDDSGLGYAVGSRWLDITNDKEYVCLDATSSAAVWKETTIVDTGEINTASNIGNSGVGVFKQKNGTDLEFKKIKGSGSVSVVSTSIYNCYEFEDNVLDTMGIQNGTIVGGVTYTTGKVGAKCANFDGVSGTKVNIGTLDVPNTSQFSISCWFKVDTFTDARLVAKADGTNTGDHVFALTIPSAAGVRFRLTTGSLGTGTEILGTTGLSIGTWYHVIAWYDGANYKIYLNGSQDATASKTGLVPTSGSINTSIGNQPDGGGGDRAFDGKIDQVIFWNTALTTQEISDLYNSGSGRECSFFMEDNLSIVVIESAITLNNLSGTLSVEKGGTGKATLNSGNFLQGNGTGAVTTTKSVPTGSVVGTTDTQTLTNKTLTDPIISTISNTGTITLPTGTRTLVARDTKDTLSNKTITATTNNVACKSLHSATTVVNVADATAPSSGQVLTATSGTVATWQTPNVYGNNFCQVSSNGESQTTSTVLQTKLTLTTDSIPTGTYRLGYTFELSNLTNGVLSEVEVKLDGAVASLQTMEADNDYFGLGGFVYKNMTSGVKTATIKYRVQTTGTAVIRRARLELWQVNAQEFDVFEVIS